MKNKTAGSALEKPRHETVTEQASERPVPTINLVGVAQIRRSVARLEAQAEKTDRKVRETNAEAAKVAKRVRKAKDALAASLAQR